MPGKCLLPWSLPLGGASAWLPRGAGRHWGRAVTPHSAAACAGVVGGAGDKALESSSPPPIIRTWVPCAYCGNQRGGLRAQAPAPLPAPWRALRTLLRGCKAVSPRGPATPAGWEMEGVLAWGLPQAKPEQAILQPPENSAGRCPTQPTSRSTLASCVAPSKALCFPEPRFNCLWYCILSPPPSQGCWCPWSGSHAARSV